MKLSILKSYLVVLLTGLVAIGTLTMLYSGINKVKLEQLKSRMNAEKRLDK